MTPLTDQSVPAANTTKPKSDQTNKNKPKEENHNTRGATSTSANTKKTNTKKTNSKKPNTKKTDTKQRTGVHATNDALQGGGSNRNKTHATTDWKHLATQLSEARSGCSPTQLTQLNRRISLCTAAASVDSQQEIDDTAVNEAMRTIQNRAKQVGKTVTALAAAVVRDGLQNASLPDLADAGLVLLPWHVGSEQHGHWRLLVHARRQRHDNQATVALYDSAGGSHPIGPRTKQALAKALRVDEVRIDVKPVEQQRGNDKDCALHILNFASTVINPHVTATSWTRASLLSLLSDRYENVTAQQRHGAKSRGESFAGFPRASPDHQRRLDEVENGADAVANEDSNAYDHWQTPIESPPPFATQDFPHGSAFRPSAAGMTWGEFSATGVHLYPNTNIPWLSQAAQHSLAESTREAHRRSLNKILREMPQDLRSKNLASAVLQQLCRTRTEKHWSAATFLRVMATTQGALSQLPFYTNANWSVELNACPEWRAAMKQAQKEAHESEAVRPPTAMTSSEHQQVMERVKADPETAAFAAIAWRTCARYGDTAQLRAEDIHLDGTKLRVTWRRGKTVAFRGPYSIHTKVTEDEARHIRTHLRTKKHWLWTNRSMIAVKARDVLREINPNLEQRSVRRGAIQALAHLLPHEELCLFTGHKSVKTLLRYLGWGAQPTEHSSRMQTAAQQAISATA